MYNAEATLQDDEHHGSTRLHLDLTGTINIALWAADLPDGTLGYAIWHIFAADALPILRQFFLEEGIFKGAGDPVHSQVICLCAFSTCTE
jgi:lysine-specific demethylase 3